MNILYAKQGSGFLLIAALTGCVSVTLPPPDLASRHVGTPEHFAEDALSSSGPVGSAWLAHFADPVLEALVREAWDRNPDLYVAAARFEEAAASLRIAASILYPQLGGVAGARYTDSDNPLNDDDEYSVGVQVSWEIDLWGRLRSDRAAAESIAAASGLDFVQARHSLAAAVAEAYFATITAKQQLGIDRELLDAERFTATTTAQRVQIGLGTILDEDLAQANVQLAEAAVQNDLAALREARRALELLLGRYPSAELEGAPEMLPLVPAEPVAVGVPSDLLERRPDIRSAELIVDAAYYEVRSAQAARLPRLTLTADATQFFDPSDFITTVAANIVAPLFQGGRLRAEEAAANARQRQAVGQFASVSLRAFREVEAALSNARHLAQREAHLTLASTRLQRASEAAINRYDQGLLTILDLQQVRRQDFETRSLLLSVRFEQLRQRLTLYLALGGPVDMNGLDEDVISIQQEMLDRQFTDPSDAPLSGELHVGESTKPAAEGTQEQGHDR